MQTILDIMRSEILMLNARKKGFRRFMILVLLLLLGIGLLFPAFLTFMIPVYALIAVEQYMMNVGSAKKMYAILPVSRSQLVKARFLLLMLLLGLVTVFCFGVVGLYSLLDMANRIIGDESDDLLQTIMPLKGSVTAQFCICVCAGFCLGAIVTGVVLKIRMMHDRSERSGVKRILTGFGIFAAVYLLAMLLLAVQINVGGVIGMFISNLTNIVQLISRILNGFLLGLLLVTAGVCVGFYSCLSTELAYENKEQ